MTAKLLAFGTPGFVCIADKTSDHRVRIVQSLKFCAHVANACQAAVCPIGNRICCTKIKNTLAQIVAR